MADLKRHDKAAAVEALGEDLDTIHTVLHETRTQRHTVVEGALEELGDGELVDWVAVAVHRLPDGSTQTSIHGHPDRTALQVKGLLHDALWAAAHQP